MPSLFTVNGGQFNHGVGVETPNVQFCSLRRYHLYNRETPGMKNVTVGLGGPTVINKPGTGIVNIGGGAGKRQVNGTTFMILPPKAVIAKAEEGIKTPINSKIPKNMRGVLILL